MIKCVVTDIDQTLTNKDMQLSIRTKLAICRAKEKGIHVVLCSGRPYQGMLGYLNELNLNSEDDICIGFNGGAIFKNSTGECIESISFKEQEVYEIIEYLKQKDINFHIETTEAIYTMYNPVRHYTIRDSFITTMPLIITNEKKLIRNDVCKIMIADVVEKIDEFQLPAFANKYKFVRSRPYYLEITPRNVNKGIGVQKVAEYYGINTSEIMGIGDGLNDIELLLESGIAVAMENAAKELKDIAQKIAPHHDNDGFAVVLEDLVENQK